MRTRSSCKHFIPPNSCINHGHDCKMMSTTDNKLQIRAATLVDTLWTRTEQNRPPTHKTRGGGGGVVTLSCSSRGLVSTFALLKVRGNTYASVGSTYHPHFVRCLVIREGVVVVVVVVVRSFVLLVNGRERVINNKQHMSTVIVVNHNYFIAGRRRRSNWSRAGRQFSGFRLLCAHHQPPPVGRPSFHVIPIKIEHNEGTGQKCKVTVLTRISITIRSSSRPGINRWRAR